jgi:uncharacterized membrane-anchored protein
MDFFKKAILAPCHWIITALLFAAFCPFSSAQEDKKQEEMRAIYAEIATAKKDGPADIALGEHGTLKLPQGFLFVPEAPAKRFMKALGNQVSANFCGLVIGTGMADGFISIEYEDSGYIKEDDAKTWDADELLSNLKSGTEQANKERLKQGIGEIEVVGWVEKPTYDPLTHRLIWSASSKDKGTPTPSVLGINYNTYILGRRGFFSLNLVTNTGAVEKEKPLAKTILAATTFNEGKRYEDFNASTDRIAEYGLTALIAGVAAKKLGLLATLGVFLLKGWKLLLFGGIAVGAIAKKFFKKRN